MLRDYRKKMQKKSHHKSTKKKFKIADKLKDKYTLDKDDTCNLDNVIEEEPGQHLHMDFGFVKGI